MKKQTKETGKTLPSKNRFLTPTEMKFQEFHERKNYGIIKVETDGRIAIGGQYSEEDQTYIPIFLEPEKPVEISRKAIKPYLAAPEFTIYMGHLSDEFETNKFLAREAGTEIHLLDTVEDWGYDFIAVRNHSFTFPISHKWEGETIRWNPLVGLELTPEMEIAENDFRETKIYPSSFIWGGHPIVGAEIPAMIQAQVHTLSQAYSQVTN